MTSLNIKHIILPLLMLLCATLFATEDQYLYVYYNSSDGLSQDEVTSITQDHDGLMWFATRGGLNRFDGHQFKVIRPIFNDQKSLISSSIEKIFTDSKGRIWIGYKKGGVSIYHPQINWIEHIHFDSFNSDGRVISFMEDTDGRIYIGQWESGLTIYDYEKDIQTRILGNRRILDIQKGEGNTLWIGTNNGLVKLNSQTLAQKQITTIKNEITAINVDTLRKCLWLGLWSDELKQYNYNTDKITSHKVQGGSFRNGYSLLSTDSTHLLIGSWGNGLWQFNKNTNIFKQIDITSQINTNTSKVFSGILALYQDQQNNLWIGTNGNGIVMQKKQQNIFQHALIGEDKNNKPVSQIFQDDNGTYFFGAENYGLAFSDDLEHYSWADFTKKEQRSRIICFFPLTQKKTLLGSIENRVKIIERNGKHFNVNNALVSEKDDSYLRKLSVACKHRSSNLYWLGTQQRGLILANIDSVSNEISIIKRFHPKHKDKRYCISDNRVSSLISDSVLWIGTYGGLDYYDYKNDSIVHFSNEDIVGSLSDKIILSFSIDKSGNIWCGTPSGLNKIYLDKKLWKIKYYGIEDGLPNAYITGVILDANGMLWVSTNNGLAVYHPKADRFNAYVKGQMSGSLRFHENSMTVNKNGEAVFGGIDGIAICKDNFTAPPKTDSKNSLYISSIKLSGQELQGRVKIDNKKYNIPSINAVDSLKISHKTKQIEISFTTLDYINLGSIRYEYQLNTKSSFKSNDWNIMRNNGLLRFDNLESGHYNLRVRAINIFNHSQGKERSIKLIIAPPPQKSWWAYSLYTTFILFIFIILSYLYKIKHNARLESLKHSQQEELNNIHIQAFVNISHEFKTPLTIISAYVKDLISNKDAHKLSKTVLKKLYSIAMSSRRMNDMIIDLATFRKSEKKGIEIHPHYLYLPDFIEQVVQPFVEIVEISKGKLKVKGNKGKQHIIIDAEKLQILLNNLLSNAIKFSSEAPTIHLGIMAYDNVLSIEVSDNGIGIAPDKIDKIFDRFYRGSSQISGSGIGLSLVKQLVNAQNGTIHIDSEEMKGTTFKVTLPYEDVNDEQIEQQSTNEENEDNSIIENISVENTIPQKSAKDKPQILLVEDKPQMMQLMADILSQDYTVLKAYDGLEGYKQAKLTLPRLIVSDISMPLSNGVQLLMKIREDKQLGNIPVLMVTGKDDQETILQCFENGADDVLKKPFDPILFKTQVEALLQMRKRLKEAYSQKIQLSSSKEEISPRQAVFITQLMATIEKNVTNPQLGLPFLAEQCSLSSSGLYRKVKTTTGKTVVDLIRTVKIETACTLLRETQRNIDSICYDAGFSDIRYFQKCFKEEKGISPSEYRKKYN